MSDELLEQIRVLRARVVELEEAVTSGADPLLVGLSERARDFLHVVTPEGRLLATARSSEGFGSVVGRSVFEFVDPAYVDVVREAYARVCATAKPVVYESIAYGEDGTPGHTYLSRAFPLVEGDTVRAIVVVPTDITERVKLERSLVEKEQALRLAIEASRMGMWRWDLGSGEITWDDRLREIWGVTQTPADYEAYLDLVHPDDRALVQSAVASALETGVYPAFEHRVRSPDGTEHWLLAVGSVLKDDNGKPIRVMGGGLDITEQKKLGAQRQRAARVESIGQLTAGIAHNFNNLLAVILPNVELMLSTSTDTQRPALSAVLDASLQARDLVRNLMALTQRDDARSKAPADAGDVAARIMGLCRVTFPREMSLQLEVAEDAGLVSMPTGDLEQVLLNLLFNARDAIELSTGPAREIQTRVQRVVHDGKPMVQLQVSDTGIGMSDDVRARVFEAFFTTKPPHKGSGLGLANVEARVKEAGGTIACESQPGVSTTFTVLLSTREASSVPVEVSAPIATETTGETLLLVDDEPLVRSVVRRLLEREGYVVMEAASAQQARELLQQIGAIVDLVILDQSMPRETGIQALPSLRALTTAPVVLFTGLAPEVPSGVAAVLEKPARPEEIERVVREALAQRK